MLLNILLPFLQRSSCVQLQHSTYNVHVTRDMSIYHFTQYDIHMWYDNWTPQTTNSISHTTLYKYEFWIQDYNLQTHFTLYRLHCKDFPGGFGFSIGTGIHRCTLVRSIPPLGGGLWPPTPTCWMSPPLPPGICLPRQVVLQGVPRPEAEWGTNFYLSHNIPVNQFHSIPTLQPVWS